MRAKFPVVHQKEGENVWVTYVKNQIKKKNNCLNSVWVGPPGSGKSYGLLSFLCLFEPDLELEGNWFFDAQSFIKAIKEDYKRGKVWGFDEAGIDFHNLDYHNELNRGLNAFLQTSRHRNYIFGFTVTYMSFLSKGVRKLMNTKMTAKMWNKNNQTIIEPRKLEFNDEKDKFYKKRLIVKKADGLWYFCNRILLPKPKKQLLIEYEKRKKEFTDNLYDQIEKNLESLRDKQQKKNGGTINSLRLEYLELLSDNSYEDIATIKVVSEGYVSQIKKKLEKDGVVFETKKTGKGLNIINRGIYSLKNEVLEVNRK